MRPMQIDIYSDVVCPWCYIGKKRLDQVLAGPVGEGVTLTWRPYQLYPNMPIEGMNRTEFLTARYGDRADRSRIPERIRTEAEDVGLNFDFAAIERMPNTFQAHRLLDYAHAAGSAEIQHELSEVLFRFHFEEGRDVGDVATLAEAAAQAGLDGGKAFAYLTSREGVRNVRAHLSAASEAGISGVPCYLLAGKFTLPGAQLPEVMEQFIGRAKERLTNE